MKRDFEDVGRENLSVGSDIGEREPSLEQQAFNALSTEAKFERLNKLVQQSKIYSQVILDDMMEKALTKRFGVKRDSQENTETNNAESMEAPEQVPTSASDICAHDATRIRRSSRISKSSSSEKNRKSVNGKTKANGNHKAKLAENSTIAGTPGKTLRARKAIQEAQVKHTQQQPSMVSGCKMKDYQLDGLGWLVSLYENGLNGILADEMGLGKTLQCISLLAYLIEHEVKGPFLVVAPLSTVSNWCMEFEKFAPKLRILRYVGSKDQRARTDLKRDSIDVVVTSYEILMKDFARFFKIEWKYLTIDEGHRLKNFQSILLRYLKKLNVGNRLLLTGTPLQNNLRELWSLLNFILPEIFHDLELFESWFSFDDLANEEIRNIEDKELSVIRERIQLEFVKHLHSVLQPFLLRRLKREVIVDIPPKKEYIIFADLTPMQKLVYFGERNGALHETLIQLHLKEYLLENHSDLFFDEVGLQRVDEVLRDRFSLRPDARRKIKSRVRSVASVNEPSRIATEDSKSSDRFSNSFEARQFSIARAALSMVESHVKNLQLQNSVMQLRNICATHYTYYEPFPFDAANSEKYDTRLATLLLENSGKIQILEQLTNRLLMDKHKVLIFSQFTKVLDLIAIYFKQKGVKCSRLDGRMDQEDRAYEVESFSSHKSSSAQVFLLLTRAGGLGLNLVHADTVILFDNDWNPQMDLQAIDRVHRIGQTKPIKVFRFVVRNTVEELLILKSFNKRALERLVIELGNFQLGQIAKELATENVEMSSIKSFSSVLELEKCLRIGEQDLSTLDLSQANAVLVGTADRSSRALTAEEMNELMDRSQECYERGHQVFGNISTFETFST